MTLSYRDVAEIVKIVDSSNCEEVCLELEGAKILIRRKGAGDFSADPQAVASSATRSSASHAPEPAARRQMESAAGSGAVAEVENGSRVCAPMVGTFYARPSPEEPEFVTVGSRVEAGTPLCMIEVMKLFTTVEATKTGTVTAILVEDGQMVEYGQPLFVIE